MKDQIDGIRKDWKEVTGDLKKNWKETGRDLRPIKHWFEDYVLYWFKR